MSLVYTTKEAVLAALSVGLLTITGIDTVDRQHVGVEEHEGVKGCFLSDVREQRRTVLQDCIVVSYTTQIVAWIYDEKFTDDPDTSTLSTMLDAIIEEVKAVIKNNFTLNSIVYKMIIPQVDTDGGFEAPYGYATFTLDINFLSNV